jgi:hypothetical protein
MNSVLSMRIRRQVFKRRQVLQPYLFPDDLESSCETNRRRANLSCKECLMKSGMQFLRPTTSFLVESIIDSIVPPSPDVSGWLLVAWNLMLYLILQNWYGSDP